MEIEIGHLQNLEIKRRHLRATPDKPFTVALIGNPNSGKTTIYNNLTKSKQHVGNYPGVTVEKKYGYCKHKGLKFRVVDLPGTYNLAADSADEKISREYLLEEMPDVVINILDASNLERNLFLTVQLLELGLPVVAVLNMSDLAISEGIVINESILSDLLKVPVIKTVGHKKVGVNEILDSLVSFNTLNKENLKLNYGAQIETYINQIQSELSEREGYSRWIALKLLEGDDDFLKEVNGRISKLEFEKIYKKIEESTGSPASIVIANARYSYIASICHQIILRNEKKLRSMSDILDMVLTHRVLGIPIFLFLMWVLFQLAFSLSEAPMAWLATGINFVSNFSAALIPKGILNSLVVDGVIAGVGGVLAFVPAIMIIFLAIAFLEDSGYMARAAFISDRLMTKIGLHGKSFIPLLLGFGCGVPAVMATRTLESRRDRLMTILLIPLMSCGARLPVYTLFIATFFSKSKAGNILFCIYVTGILMALGMAKVFNRFLFKGETSSFLLELPPYRMPTIKGISTQMWMRTKQYLKQAATVLLAASLLIWGLCNFPRSSSVTDKTNNPVEITSVSSSSEGLQKSYAGKIGNFLVPVLNPIGLGDWKIGVALFAGFAAKEVVVSTFGVLYSLGDEETEESSSLRGALGADTFFTPLKVISLLIFMLLYLPCVSLLVVMWRETGTIRWPLFAATYLTTIAWISSFIFYQSGLLLGFGG